jgi:hypothetical protein
LDAKTLELIDNYLQVKEQNKLYKDLVDESRQSLQVLGSELAEVLLFEADNSVVSFENEAGDFYVVIKLPEPNDNGVLLEAVVTRAIKPERAKLYGDSVLSDLRKAGEEYKKYKESRQSAEESK